MDRGAWQAIVHEVAKSWTLVKQLRMHVHTKTNLISNHEESRNKYMKNLEINSRDLEFQTSRKIKNWQ